MGELGTDPGPQPELFETVWFYVPDTDGCIDSCRVWDRRVWHLGWWDGRCWNSYVMARPIQPPEVKRWCRLNLPGEKLLAPAGHA